MKPSGAATVKVCGYLERGVSLIHPKAPRATAGTLDSLVQQFSQPLAFLRELVQNALDAQSNRVDIEVAEAVEPGLVCISVKDTGEGMNREIIDSSLTRLFSSGKENDLTKVGKFGIGFVSVFAVHPEAVLVDTGRDGESWRLVFHPDKTFDRILLEQPVEGCQVSVFVKAELADLIARCAETVRFWCRHCRVDVFLNGERLNQRFAFEDGFQIYHEQPGTRLVVQAVAAAKPFFGFYNQGLTLLEGAGSTLANVAFKLDSRYLEHTLTRDNIIHDEHFERAMKLLERVVEVQFPEELGRRLREAPDAEGWRACSLLIGRVAALRECAIWPVYGHRDGDVVSCNHLRGPVAYSETASALVEALGREADPPLILRGGPGCLWWGAALAADMKPEEVGSLYSSAEGVPQSGPLEKLLKNVSRLTGSSLVWAGRWQSRPGRLKSSLSYQTTRAGRPFPLFGSPPRAGGLRALLGARAAVMLDVDHASWRKICLIAERDLALAAGLLAQRILLEQGWVGPVETLGRLFEGALGLRPK